MKILVRAMNWVGDAVMCMPTLEAIRRLRPGAEIVLLARPLIADLYHDQRCADRIILYDYRGRHHGVLGREEVIRQLRRERFDTAVVLQNAFDAAYLAWRARIPERIGYARDGRSWLLTKAVPVPREGEIPTHEVYYYLELLRRAGWFAKLPTVRHTELEVPQQAREAARGRLLAGGARAGVPWIAFAPGASYSSEKAKAWPPERYSMLADRLVEGLGAQVILFGAPQEKDVSDQVAGMMQHPALNMAGATAARELPAMLSTCHLFVGNDSGATHVAGAVGLPLVVIFGPTDEERTGPVTPRGTVVRRTVSCSPCHLVRCPLDHRCMTRVSVDEVFAAACARLESRGETEAAESGRKSIG